MKKPIHALKIVTVLSTVALLVAGCSDVDSTEGQVNNVPTVKVWKVGEAAQTGLIASGKVVADEEIQVVSKLPGKVAQVHVKEGSVVKKGDALVELESTDYVQQMKQAESSIVSARARMADVQAGTRSQELQRLASGVEQAKAGLQVARNTYNRMQVLYQSGAISQAEFEKASLELEKARTGYEQGKAQLDLAKAGPTSNSVAALQADVDRLQTSLEMAKTAYQNTKIQAPIAGLVARRSIDSGEMAQSGVPLLMLVKMDEVKIEASVPQEQINQIKVGSTVQVRVSGLGDKSYTGVIDFVSPISDSNTSTFPVKVKVKNSDATLRAGMLAEVYLEEGNNPTNQWKLPASAVVQKENKNYVYKVTDDVVHQVEVTLDKTSHDWVVVTNGIADRDQIVLNPSDKLEEGSKVRVN